MHEYVHMCNYVYDQLKPSNGYGMSSYVGNP